MAEKQVVTVPGGTPKWTRDAAANDSDKSFTVPTGKVWYPIALYALFKASATVGNRIVITRVSNGTNAIWEGTQTGSIAASVQAVYSVIWGPAKAALADTTNLRELDNEAGGVSTVAQHTAFPQMFLPAGYVIRVWDIAAIDAAADDMTVIFHYIEYEA